MTSKQLKLSSLFGTLIAALTVAAISGCHPPEAQVTVSTPPPPPPPTTTTVTPAPVYTEEWVDMPIIILYPSGGSRLDDQARAMMRELHASAAARTDIVRISVHGHADSRGNAAANQQLALERAQGVVDFAVGELGMPRELFEIHGHGSDDTLTSGTTAADRLQNRRVTFRILVRRQAAHQ